MITGIKRGVVCGLCTMLASGMVSTALVGQEPRPTQTNPGEASPVQAAGEAIDFARARELLLKLRNGEKLTADEEAYLRKAQAARRDAQRPLPNPGDPAMRQRVVAEPRETVGLKPLTEMTENDRYKGEDGGLYGKGRNTPPDQHRIAAEAELARIVPLNPAGSPDADGRVVFISISMSNATQEFSRFKQLADADREKARRLTIVDCAQGGQAMAEWAGSQAPPWREAERRIAQAGVTPNQVQTAWVKLANKSPSGDLTDHGRKLYRDTLAVIQEAKSRFPNLRIIYLSSRIYGGYASGNLNPEPYAYESAFVVRWLIQDQIAGKAELNFDPERGPVKAPLLLWGPYLWADGTTPRLADKLIYTRDDLARDGTHPSESGKNKVAGLMLDFYKSDPLAGTWFRGN